MIVITVVPGSVVIATAVVPAPIISAIVIMVVVVIVGKCLRSAERTGTGEHKGKRLLHLRLRYGRQDGNALFNAEVGQRLNLEM